MSKFVYAIEGLDRLGKSTLIKNIQQQLGFYQVIHFSKPEKLAAYCDPQSAFHILHEGEQNIELQHYQYACFCNSMKLAQSGAKLIFDRWHLGEAVYSPLYRKYDGNYVFDLERKYKLDETNFVRLILLVEDFNVGKHFVSDGDSFDDTKRKEEQALFVSAFNKSHIVDKLIICVTDPETGNFRPAADILKEALV